MVKCIDKGLKKNRFCLFIFFFEIQREIITGTFNLYQALLV